ncbi:hypothetical protein BaRGS_00033009, partial [Batillaria attramentaria]
PAPPGPSGGLTLPDRMAWRCDLVVHRLTAGGSGSADAENAQSAGQVTWQ